MRGNGATSAHSNILHQAAAREAIERQKAELINAEIRRTAQLLYVELIKERAVGEFQEVTAEDFRRLAKIAANAAPFIHEALGWCEVNVEKG